MSEDVIDFFGRKCATTDLSSVYGPDAMIGVKGVTVSDVIEDAVASEGWALCFDASRRYMYIKGDNESSWMFEPDEVNSLISLIAKSMSERKAVIRNEFLRIASRRTFSSLDMYNDSDFDFNAGYFDSDLKGALKEYPQLTIDGITSVRDSDFKHKRDILIDECNNDPVYRSRIAATAHFMMHNLKTKKSTIGAVSSYHLKHEFENLVGYLTNGHFIIALCLGCVSRRTKKGESSLFVGIGSPGWRKLKARLDNHKEFSEHVKKMKGVI